MLILRIELFHHVGVYDRYGKNQAFLGDWLAPCQSTQTSKGDTTRDRIGLDAKYPPASRNSQENVSQLPDDREDWLRILVPCLHRSKMAVAGTSPNLSGQRMRDDQTNGGKPSTMRDSGREIAANPAEHPSSLCGADSKAQCKIGFSLARRSQANRFGGHTAQNLELDLPGTSMTG